MEENNEGTYSIYKITCLVNGKVYVGATGKTVAERFYDHWDGHCSTRAKRRPIYQDMFVLGRDAFVVETVESNLSQEEAALREDYWINKLGADGYVLYNQKRGGGCIKLTERQEKEIIQLYEDGFSMYDIADLVKKSYATISRVLHQYEIGIRNPSKAVLCVESGDIYGSAVEAAQQLGLNRSSISACCRGEYKSTGGLHFCFPENKDVFVIQESKSAPKKVVCVDTNIIYDSIADAARELGLHQQSISACCHGKRKMVNGMHFCFLKDKDTFIIQESKTHPAPKKIFCIETNVVYPSAGEAARQLGLHKTAISKCCRGESKSTGGLHFCFEKDKDTFVIQELTLKKVLCVETNAVYDSITEAARQLGLDRSNISACCRGKQKSTGGYHFCYPENKDKFVIQESKTAPKKVLCIETNIVYESCADAAKQLGLNHGNISACCCRKVKSTGGLHFCFPEDKDTFVVQESKRGRTSKEVLCIETNIVYESIKEAAQQLGLYSSSISSCCLGKRKTAGGYHFEFAK